MRYFGIAVFTLFFIIGFSGESNALSIEGESRITRKEYVNLIIKNSKSLNNFKEGQVFVTAPEEKEYLDDNMRCLYKEFKRIVILLNSKTYRKFYSYEERKFELNESGSFPVEKCKNKYGKDHRSVNLKDYKSFKLEDISHLLFPSKEDEKYFNKYLKLYKISHTKVKIFSEEEPKKILFSDLTLPSNYASLLNLNNLDRTVYKRGRFLINLEEVYKKIHDLPVSFHITIPFEHSGLIFNEGDVKKWDDITFGDILRSWRRRNSDEDEMSTLL